MTTHFIHYGLHLLLPLAAALIFFKEEWKKAFLIMIVCMLVDLDHLLAEPVFDPGRCSIGFHPLHSYYAIAIYIILLLIPAIRIIAAGLLIHMLVDGIDCWLMSFKECRY